MSVAKDSAERRVLLLGGLDPSGGAGLTADATVVALHGLVPLPVPVCLTVQGLGGFRRLVPVERSTWREALAAVLDDGPVHAIKLGLLGDAGLARELAEVLTPIADVAPLVLDPVLSATAGGLDAPAELARVYRERLLPLAAVFTPNLPELAAIGAGRAAVAIEHGAGAVLVKGGHGDGPLSEDLLHLPGAHFAFRRERLPVGSVRGTGCALGSAIASGLAAGLDVPLACQRAGDWLHALLRQLGPAPAPAKPRLLPWASVRPRSWRD